jgi:hypothetical protein
MTDAFSVYSLNLAVRVMSDALTVSVPLPTTLFEAEEELSALRTLFSSADKVNLKNLFK